MNPKSIIVRHPGMLPHDARANIRRELQMFFGEDVPVLVLCQGMQAWILGDDGAIYDLNNSGNVIEGEFNAVEVGESPKLTATEAMKAGP
jgi:hypothetical protein